MAKLIVAMTQYGESPVRVTTIYKAFERHKGVYYSNNEIDQIIDDDTKDYIVIAGDIGKKKYDKSIPMKKAAIHYIVSCALKKEKDNPK